MKTLYTKLTELHTQALNLCYAIEELPPSERQTNLSTKSSATAHALQEWWTDELKAKGRKPAPTVVCLCGSTRFIETFAIKQWELEREGKIVLGCVLLPESYCKVADHFAEHSGCKEQCDELHRRKIDLADEVLVLNVGGYIGESTRGEIAYATELGKPVSYLEPLNDQAHPTAAESDRGRH